MRKELEELIDLERCYEMNCNHDFIRFVSEYKDVHNVGRIFYWCSCCGALKVTTEVNRREVVATIFPPKENFDKEVLNA